MSLADWFSGLVEERSVRLLAEIAGVVVTLWLQAAVLLLLALVVRRWIRLPALRVTLAWATVAGLSVLPVLVWLPGWRVLSLMAVDVTDVVAKPVINVAAVPAVPVPVEALREQVAVEDRASEAVPVPASVVAIDPVTDNLTNTVPPLAEATLPGPDSTLAEAASEAVEAAVPTPGERLLDPADAELATPELVTTESASDPVPALPAPNLVATQPPGSPTNAPLAMQASVPSPVLIVGHRGRTWIQAAAPVVLVASSVMAGLVLVWSCLGGWFVSRLLWRSRPAGDDLLAELDAVRSATPGRRGPRLLISREVSVPAAVGVWRPTILLPEMVLDDESRPAVRAALRHELAHIERGDLWLLCWSRWLSPVYATQPLWWLFRGAMRVDQELTADAMAAGDDPVGYAEALVGWAKAIHREVERRSWLGQSWLGRTWLGRAWGRMGRPEFQLSDSPGSLTRRVAMLLDPRRMFAGRISRWMKAGLVLLLLGWTVCASLIAVTEPGSAGAWWRGVMGYGRGPDGLPAENFALPTTVVADAPGIVTLASGNTVFLADTGPAKAPVAAEIPVGAAKALDLPAVPSKMVQIETLVGWIEEERVAAATGAARLILPEGPTEAIRSQGRPVPLALWLKSSDMQFRMKLARENKLIKELGEPSLITRFNQPAEFFSGGELPQLKIVERVNGTEPPELPSLSSAVPIGLQVQTTVSDNLTPPDPFGSGHLGTIDVRVSWSSKRDEATVDRQVLSGRADWKAENMSLFLTEPRSEKPNPETAATPRQRLFAVITPRIVDANDLAQRAPAPGWNQDPGFDPLASPPRTAEFDVSEPLPVPPLSPPRSTPVAPVQVEPVPAVKEPAVALPPTVPDALVAPPVKMTTVPPPAQELIPDVQYFDPAPAAKPVAEAAALRVNVRKLTWLIEPNWSYHRGKPTQVDFELDPALSWKFSPFVPGDARLEHRRRLYQVPIFQDIQVMLEHQQARLRSAEDLQLATEDQTEFSIPVEHGMARLACPMPTFPTSGIALAYDARGVAPTTYSATAAVDVMVRPDYDLLSDGRPGLKGFSGAILWNAMKTVEIIEHHTDLPPSRLAELLKSRGRPDLSPFQVPPGGGLVLLMPYEPARWKSSTVVTPWTALVLSFESTLSDEDHRRLAAEQMAQTPSVKSEGSSHSQTKVAASAPLRSLVEARTEVLRLLEEYPRSQTPFADLRRATMEFAIASVRDDIARIPAEPLGESEEASFYRLEPVLQIASGRLDMASQFAGITTGVPKLRAERYPSPIESRYTDELKAIGETLNEIGRPIEEYRKKQKEKRDLAAASGSTKADAKTTAPAPNAVEKVPVDQVAVKPNIAQPVTSQDEVVKPAESTDPAPTAKPVAEASTLRVKVRKLTWKTEDPKWTVNKGKPNEDTFPLNPARTWSILPFAAGDLGRVLMPAAFHVPLRRDFDAILVEQQLFSPAASAPYVSAVSPAGRADTEYSQPVENGIARLAFPEPLFQTVVVQPEVSPFVGRGSAALDVIVRPEYGLLSDGSPGLKGYSGVLRMGAMLDAEIGAKHADLSPSRLAKMLLNRGVPMLCPFQVPPGGGLIVCQLPSAALNHENDTVDDDMDRTALFISFSSTLDEDNQRRFAEMQLAYRARASSPDASGTPPQVASPATTSPATTGPIPSRSPDAARTELQRLLAEYPNSRMPLADLWQAIIEYEMASLRARVARLSVEPPNESPQERLSRLEQQVGPLSYQFQMMTLLVARIERTSANTLASRFPAPVAPQYLEELGAMANVVSEREKQVEALRKSLNEKPAPPSGKSPATGDAGQPATAPPPVKPPSPRPPSAERKVDDGGRPAESKPAALVDGDPSKATPAVKKDDTPQDGTKPGKSPQEKPQPGKPVEASPKASTAEPAESKPPVPSTNPAPPAPASKPATDQAEAVDSNAEVRVKVQLVRLPAWGNGNARTDGPAQQAPLPPGAVHQSWTRFPVVPGEPVRVLNDVYGILNRDRLAEMFGQKTPGSDALIGEWSFPAVGGVAQLACPTPVLDAMVFDNTNISIAGPRESVADRGVMAVDLVIRPEYGLLSDGRPGLKGYSGVVVAGASPRSNAAERFGDLSPDKVAAALKATGFPTLCPFELPPDGGLIIRSLFSGSFWASDSDRTVFLVTIESTRTVDEQRRDAEAWLAARSRANKTVISKAAGDAPSTEMPRSVVEADDELRRFLQEFPTSTNSLGEFREALAHVVFARLRKQLVDFSPYGPHPSPSARRERLAGMGNQYDLALEWLSPFIAAAERKVEPFTGALSPALSPESYSGLKSIEAELQRRVAERRELPGPQKQKTL